MLGRVTPSRVPSSISACSTHLRTDSWPTPTWRATAADAVVSDGYCDRCSRTKWTARSRSAGSILFGMTYILPTQKDAASNPGRFMYPRRVSPPPSSRQSASPSAAGGQPGPRTALRSSGLGCRCLVPRAVRGRDVRCRHARGVRSRCWSREPRRTPNPGNAFRGIPGRRRRNPW